MDNNENVVVFEVLDGSGTARTATGAAPVRDEECIRKVWNEVTARGGLKTTHVRRIYSEWEPSPADNDFIRETFPARVEVTYAFSRPGSPADWPAALARAADAQRKATIEQQLKEAADNPYLPVLRGADAITAAMVHRPLVGGFALCLARIGRTPRGTQGLDFVMAAGAAGDLDQAWRAALENARRGVRVNATKEGGDRFFTVVRQDGMATSILADPDFLKRAAEWLGTDRFYVGWPDPDLLVIWSPTIPMSKDLEQRLLSSRAAGPVSLDPAVLLVERGKVSVHAR